MSSSQVYPTLPTTIDPQQICGDATSGISSPGWYAPISVCQPSNDNVHVRHAKTETPANPFTPFTNTHGFQYAYNDAYITPYPSSTVESQPWNTYARASVPDLFSPSYALHQPQVYQGQNLQYLNQFKDPSRPRSSPSTFGPTAEHITWPSTDGLGIQYTSTAPQLTPITSTFPPVMYQTYPMNEQYGTASPPEIAQPQPRRPYTNIAPNPASIIPVKRERDEDEPMTTTPSSKRRNRTGSGASADLSEDDRFLIQLKEDDNLPWKDIANRFHNDKGKSFQVAALQMRYKRLREKFRQWEAEDLSALTQAHEYWEKYKWEIIRDKMLDFGLQERWTARQCARKWQDIEEQSTPAGRAPGMTHYSSPAEGPIHFGFVQI